MMTSAVIKHPLLSWAQRSHHIYLSIGDGDMKVENLLIEEDKFKFKYILI
jgi:hypothetical protein